MEKMLTPMNTFETGSLRPCTGIVCFPRPSARPSLALLSCPPFPVHRQHNRLLWKGAPNDQESMD